MSFASLKIKTTHCKEQMREWKKIVVASDSFKGCLTSLEVASAVEIAILQKYPCCQVVKVSVADGGEGTVDAVISSLNGESITADVHDPLGRLIKAQYMWKDYAVSRIQKTITELLDFDINSTQ